MGEIQCTWHGQIHYPMIIYLARTNPLSYDNVLGTGSNPMYLARLNPLSYIMYLAQSNPLSYDSLLGTVKSIIL